MLMLLLPVALPKMAADPKASPLREISAFAQLQVWLTLGTAAVGFGGFLAVYSYIAPTLTELAGIEEGAVPFYLALWGLGMVIGNVIGGRLADKWLNGSIIGLLAWNISALWLFSLVASVPALAAIMLVLVGMGFALVPALQTRLMDVAPRAQSLAAAMNHSAFNLSNAIGAWTGGLAISAGWGWASTGAVGALLALGGVAIFIPAVLLEKSSSTISRSKRPANAH
jgi:DHA1 family inner membrane transport protein